MTASAEVTMHAPDGEPFLLRCGERSLRLGPALTTSEEALEIGCGALERVINERDWAGTG